VKSAPQWHSGQSDARDSRSKCVAEVRLFRLRNPTPCPVKLSRPDNRVRNRRILYHHSMRIVSLLPSATEILCAVGGEDLLVGRSHECDFPPSIRDRPVLTRARTDASGSAAIDAQVRESLAAGDSLYQLDGNLLAELRPDLIITQDLCSVCSIDVVAVRQIAEGLPSRPALLSLNPKTLEDVFDDHLRVGEAAGLAADAADGVVRLRDRYWSAIDYVTPYTAGPEVAVLEWMDPLFVAGHWTPQMILAAGGQCSLMTAGMPSRAITPDELVAAQPDRIVIAPCGLSLPAIRNELALLTTSRWWQALPAAADGDVFLVDGNQMFSRPGPRLVDAFCWLVGWINDRPELLPKDFPCERLIHAER
jgi:iron complex transport system substrate-binding protein